MLAKEIAWGHYFELTTAHPGRVTLGLTEFEAEFARRLIDENGAEDPFRFALGTFTTGRSFAAFARPRTNTPARSGRTTPSHERSCAR